MVSQALYARKNIQEPGSIIDARLCNSRLVQALEEKNFTLTQKHRVSKNDRHFRLDSNTQSITAFSSWRDTLTTHVIQLTISGEDIEETVDFLQTFYLEDLGDYNVQIF